MELEQRLRFNKIRRRFFLIFFAIVFPVLGLMVMILYRFQILSAVPDSRMSMMMMLIIIGLTCSVSGLIVSAFYINYIIRPLEQISAGARRVAKGDYKVRINERDVMGEMEQTVQDFNFMVHELNSVEMMRNDFISSVSHEFKTPLASITGYAMLLRDDTLLESERQEYLESLIVSVEGLNELTGNILLLSKLENQHQMPEAETYRLDEQIRQMIVMLEPEWSAKNIELDIELEKVVYTGQRQMLSNVWMNLIENAIKFSDSGGTIRISLTGSENDIRMQVRDEGIGMDEQTRKHLFEKFFQGDTSRKQQGNGLGLALCGKIIELTGGRIDVESEPGEGSTFTVVLPVNLNRN